MDQRDSDVVDVESEEGLEGRMGRRRKDDPHSSQVCLRDLHKRRQPSVRIELTSLVELQWQA